MSARLEEMKLEIETKRVETYKAKASFFRNEITFEEYLEIFLNLKISFLDVKVNDSKELKRRVEDHNERIQKAIDFIKNFGMADLYVL